MAEAQHQLSYSGLALSFAEIDVLYIDGQIADGLMRNAPLTFKDVETVKNVFVEKLKIMYHTRISYPDLKK